MKTTKTLLLYFFSMAVIAGAIDFFFARQHTVTGYVVDRMHEAELSRKGSPSPLTRQNQADPQDDENYMLEVRTDYGDFKAGCNAATYHGATMFQPLTITRNLGLFSGHCWSAEVVE